MITGIIVALPEELTTLSSSKLKKSEVCKLDNNTLLCLSGTGPENATYAAKILIEQGAKKLLSWGCAAALIKALKPGDLVLPSSLIAASGETYYCNQAWQRQVSDLLKPQIEIGQEPLAESATLVCSSEQKQALHQQTGAAIVDMESTAIAKLAAEHSLPFVAIRVVADSVQMQLPDAVALSLDTDGVIQLPRLLSHLLWHPTEFPDLIRLGRSFSAAKKTLCLVAKQLVIISGFSPSER